MKEIKRFVKAKARRVRFWYKRQVDEIWERIEKAERAMNVVGFNEIIG